MKKIKVTCDSTCDLTRELYASYGVEAVPMGVYLGEKLRRDGVDVTAEEIFDYVNRTGKLPGTSAISMGEYEQVFTRLVEDCQVIHICLSGDLSSSYQNACIAAEWVGDVTVIDSRSLSTGSGLLVLLAVELARSGMGAEEICGVLENAKRKLDVSFVLQTLDYLRKGGRCSGLAAFGANLLKLRPEIVVTDGKMHVGKKYRGSMEKTVLDYIRGRLEGRTDIDPDRIFITHTGVPAEIVEKAKGLILELQPFAEVIETRAGCTISSHCGPNCLGVLFFKK